MTWTCPRCDGVGFCECGDPHANIISVCGRCRKSGKITHLEGLSEAVSISDLSALEFVLRDRQSQSDLDRALGSAISLPRPEHARLLLQAGADVQAGLGACVDGALRVRPGGFLPQPTAEQAGMLRLLLESGATVGDKEMQCVDDAFRYVERTGSRKKETVEAFADILVRARSKVLSLHVEDTCSDFWIIQVHSLGGERVATINAIPSSMTLGELQVEIESQASIPCRFQHLIFGRDKIQAQSVQLQPLSELLR